MARCRRDDESASLPWSRPRDCGTRSSGLAKAHTAGFATIPVPGAVTRTLRRDSGTEDEFAHFGNDIVT